MCPQHDRPASHAIYLFKCLKSRDSIIIPTPVRVVELCRCGVKKKKKKILLIDGSISFKNVSPGHLKEADFKSWSQPGVCNTELTSQMLVSLKSPQHLYSLHTSCLWNFRVQSTKKKNVYIYTVYIYLLQLFTLTLFVTSSTLTVREVSITEVDRCSVVPFVVCRCLLCTNFGCRTEIWIALTFLCVRKQNYDSAANVHIVPFFKRRWNLSDIFVEKQHLRSKASGWVFPMTAVDWHLIAGIGDAPSSYVMYYWLQDVKALYRRLIPFSTSPHVDGYAH